jgi:asparagine N-glycosylation enzyme membrane subunit Stt3
MLFAKRWMKENGFTDESMKGANMLKIFGLSLLLMLFASFNLAMFVGRDAGASFGATAGFMAGLGWVFTFMGVIYVFERKSLALFIINACYSVVSLTIMGLVIGVWQ